MRSLPRPPAPQEVLAETLRGHFQAVSALVGQGADEAAIGAALTAAEGAGLDRTALRQAVRGGRIGDKERRAEVAVRLDIYRAMLDPTPPLPGLASPEPTSQPG